MTAGASVRNRDGDAASHAVQLPATALGVRGLSPWLTALLDGLDPTEAAAVGGRLELATHEVCMNAVDHAGLPPGSTVRVQGWVTPEAVVVQVADDGAAFDASGVVEPVPGVAQERGYGLMIVRQLVDEFGYRREPGRNLWTLRLDRRRDAAPEPTRTAIPEEES